MAPSRPLRTALAAITALVLAAATASCSSTPANPSPASGARSDHLSMTNPAPSAGSVIDKGASGGTVGSNSGDSVSVTSTDMSAPNTGDSQHARVPSRTGQARSTAAHTPMSQTLPSQARPDCTTGTWSTAGAASQGTLGGGTVPLERISTSANGCADTIGITPSQPDASYGYQVSYVPEVRSQGSGEPLGLAGAATLQVIVGLPSYDAETGDMVLTMASKQNMVAVTGLTTVQQVGYGGSFEGQTTIGIGVDQQRPFAVDVDADGTLTIRIAHDDQR